MQEANQHQVLKYLGWNALQFGQFQMDTGLEYLEIMMGGDGAGIKALSTHAMFWSWWKNHWDKRDLTFLLYATHLEPAERLEYYKALHQAREINFRPHRAIMEPVISKTKTRRKEPIK